MRDLSKVLLALKKQREKAKADLDRLAGAIAALAGTAGPVKEPAASHPVRSRRFSAAARKAASDRMKKYWADRSQQAKN